MRRSALVLLVFPVLALGADPEPKPVPATPPAAAREKPAPPAVSTELKAAISKLKLPGIKIDLEEWCVDVDSSVCLQDGLLELIACTKDTKEHESIVVVEAKPSHIHTALLLLGARAGSPAMQKMIGEKESPRFISIPPSGGNVDVFLVIKGADGKPVEHPISDFITRNDRDDPSGLGNDPKLAGESDKFPTHTFLFAGSVLSENNGGPRTYYCDLNGNVISIATFGDEVLCLPEVHASDNGSLIWQIKDDTLPAIGTKVTLRLRPQIKSKPPVPQDPGKPQAK